MNDHMPAQQAANSLGFKASLGDAVASMEPEVVCHLPSASIAEIIDRVELRASGGGFRVIRSTREEDAVGVLSGVAMAGSLGILLIQDNGLGNSLTALTTLPLAYRLPLLVLCNVRGGLGEYNSMIHHYSQGLPKALESFGLATFWLDRTLPLQAWQEGIIEAGSLAQMSHRPVIGMLNFFGVESLEGSL